ncbi:MAG: DUF4328 domain-containing protein [Bacteroidia bacterium]|nr:DUF4328 domain-containing protein [Bacteroidia bacterium]
MQLKNNESRGKSIIITLWIIVILYIFELIASIYQGTVLEAIQLGKKYTIEEANAIDIQVQIITGIAALTYIVSVVLFILWFRRAYYNIHQMMDNLEYTEAAAAYSWFIPILNLFQPFKIMRELYKQTIKILENHNRLTLFNLNTKALAWWWALWIISNVIGNIIFRFNDNTISLSEMLAMHNLKIVYDFMNIGLTLITIKVVRDYTKVENTLHEVSYEIDNDADNLSHHLVD